MTTREPDRGDASPPADHVARLVREWEVERPDLDVSPLEVVYRVTRLAAHLAAEIDTVFAGSGLTSADFAVLANLRRAGRPFELPQRTLGTRLGLTSGTVSVRIDRLATAGLVERRPDPRDGRGVVVSLTADGATLFDQVAPAHLANEARLISALDDDQRAQLAELLQVLLIEHEGPVDPRPDERIGLRVAPAFAGQLRRAAVGLPGRPGLLVEAVRPDGAAGRAGVRPGDLLVRGGDRDLRSLTCLHRAIRAAPDGFEVELERAGEQISARLDLTEGTAR